MTPANDDRVGFEKPVPCPHGSGSHEGHVEAIHSFPAPDLDQILRDNLAPRQCRNCGAEYLGDATLPLCPMCEKAAQARHLQRLQDRRAAVMQELADLNGQINSLLKHIIKTSVVPLHNLAESERCGKCRGWLHFGYVDRTFGEGEHKTRQILCRPCALREGIKEGFKQSEWCRHNYPLYMCRPCRWTHSEKMKLAEKAARSLDQAGAGQTPRHRAAPGTATPKPKARDLSDAEEI